MVAFWFILAGVNANFGPSVNIPSTMKRLDSISSDKSEWYPGTVLLLGHVLALSLILTEFCLS